MGNTHSSSSANRNRTAQQPKVVHSVVLTAPAADGPSARVVRTASLILPDFPDTIVTTQTLPAKTASIPIKGRQPREKYYVQPSAHIPKEYQERNIDTDDQQSDDEFRPPSPPAPFIPPTPALSAESIDVPRVPKGSPTGRDFQPGLVMSGLKPPIKFHKSDEKPVAVTISWKFGGKRVVLARAGDDEWNGRRTLKQDPLNPEIHSITISLLPGTHHLRFLVDDQWRVADDLPTAVDDQGSLANYVAVGVNGIVVDDLGVGAGVPAEEGRISRITLPPPSISHPRAGIVKVAPTTFWSSASADAQADDPYSRTGKDVWTTTVPRYLREKVFEREMQEYLMHLNGDTSGSTPGPHRINGFVSAPRVIEAPSVPPHLQKPLLNRQTRSKSASQAGAATVVGAVDGSRVHHERTRHQSSGRPGKRSSHTKSMPTPPPSNCNTANSSPTLEPCPPPQPALFSQINLGTPGVDETVVADDTSVLPVPSHVVLHHLSTCATRENDVFAVSSTVRYRGKYLTTVYYKPTELPPS